MKKKLFVLFMAAMLACTGVACKKGENTSEVPTEPVMEGDFDIALLDLDQYMTLGEYKGVKVEYEPSTTTDENVEEQVRYMMMEYSDEIALYEGTAEDGSYVNINYVGYLDGVAFDGGTANNQNIVIGSKRYIEGFEESIIGMTPGETKDCPMTFPEDYGNEELAGKDVVFTITLNFIYPELTDEVVQKMNNEAFTTVDELKAYARKLLEDEDLETNQSNVVYLGISKIIQNSTFKELPQSLKDDQRKKLEERYKTAIEGGAGDLNTVIKYIYDCTADELIEEFVKQRMVIQAIARLEGLTMTNEQISAMVEEEATANGTTLGEYLVANGMTIPGIKEQAVSEKVQQFIYDNTVTVPYGTLQEDVPEETSESAE